MKRKKRKSKVWLSILFWAIVIIYAVMPSDLIPDVPLIGWVDDFIVIALRLLMLKMLKT